MTNEIYTVISFAPVQGFIEKSRKLRDLYGSSYLLSYLSWVICKAAEQHHCKVVSPALPNVTQGMPNQIIIEGNFTEEDAKSAFDTAWECVTQTCRDWIEKHVSGEYYWKRNWDLWTTHAWEFFWVKGESGESISDVRQRLNNKKYWRDWTGINWQGESSTLSGADAIAYPKLGQISDPRQYNYQQEKKDVTAFYNALSEKLGESFIKSVGLKVPDEKMSERSKEYGESFIDPDEELSVPELIKRLITHNVIADKLTERLKQAFGNNGVILKNLAQQINQLSEDLKPTRFTDLSRITNKKRTGEQIKQDKFWSGWFHGDGDKAAEYLKSLAKTDEEAKKTNEFSKEMRKWADDFKKLPETKTIANWRVVYAGGDDFLGVFYDRKNAVDCVNFFSRFKTDTWNEGIKSEEKKKITVSVGFVWAGPGVPQRDVLQHCRLAEKSAKSNGRDRIAFRVLFNNGNHLEWVCPWWLLEAGLLSSYRDREHNQEKPNWTHIYNDVAVLESRHVFDDKGSDDGGLDVALGLLEIYFPEHVDIIKNRNKQLHESDADLTTTKAGILGDRKSYYKENTEETDESKVKKALTNWIINLAKLGFHLCQESKQ
ncbi:CRISPR-associated protein [Scytonema tolypothrichoides VB-61278]|nr:CRISPR-associated protein [Scytonema tolypothrichoides VB-61278]